MTSAIKVYNKEQGIQIQLYFKELVNAHNFDQNLESLRDREQMLLMLKIQSNLLQGCEWLEISR